MSNSSKYMVIASMVIAGLIAVAAALDMFMNFPFGGNKIMDGCFLVGAGLTLFLGWDSYQDLS